MVTGDPVVDTGTAVSIVDDPAAVVGEAEAGGNIGLHRVNCNNYNADTFMTRR